MKYLKSYHPYALTTAVLWSLAYVLTRLALRSFSPFPLGFLRYLCASLLLLAILLVKKLGLPAKKDLVWLILSGASGFFLYMLTFNGGSRTVTAATSCAVISATPILTALFARVFYKERLTALQYVSVFIAFGGVVVLTVMNLRLTPGAGLYLIIAAAVLLSIYNLLQRKLARSGPSLRTTAYSIFFGTLMLGIFAPQAFGELRSATPTGLVCMLLLGVFCGAVAYCSWTKAMALAENTASVSNYMFIEPFLTAVMGLFIGEELGPSTLIGGAIIVLGLFLFYFGDRLFRKSVNTGSR